MIKNYNDFITELFKVGFSGAVFGKEDGVFGLFRYGWGAEEETGIEWFTGNQDTDPWQWRERVLNERDDIAYAKIFLRKGGYITKEWYPYFLAARRGYKDFEDDYAAGIFSHAAKRIYDVVSERGSLPVDEIKRVAGFQRKEKSKFESALNDLQMRLYLTMKGVAYKVSSTGEQYGWGSMVYTTTENFWGEDLFNQASKIDPEDAVDKIAGRVLELNSYAEEKKIMKFIKG